MPRNNDDTRGPIPCEEKAQQAENRKDLERPPVRSRSADLAARLKELAGLDDNWKVHTPSTGPAWAENLKTGEIRHPDLRSFTLKETTCRVDYSTGELLCQHSRAPKSLDCRLPFCHYRDVMRKRISLRQRLALERKRPGGQS